MPNPEIHVIRSRQPLIKYHQPGDCACGQIAIRKCKHCDLPLCQRCAYLSDEGILCSECTGKMEYEAALILIGGRAG